MACGLAVAVWVLWLFKFPHRPLLGYLTTAGLIAILLSVAWIRPLLVQRRGQSESVQFDDGLVVAGILLLPWALLFVLFLAVGAIAQVRMRRSLLKSLFNVSQLSVSLGAALLVGNLVASQSRGVVTPTIAAGALLAGATFALVSAAAVAVALVSSGAASARQAFGENLDLRIQTLLASTALGLLSAIAARYLPLTLGLLPVAFFVLRYAMAGQFTARHDSDRVRGLLKATLSIQESMDSWTVLNQICDSVPRLLSCRSVALAEAPQPSAELVVRLDGGERPLWLSIEERVGSQPFSNSDRQLLEALAAVGQTALSHANLYASARRHEDQLSAIMTSLAEGLVAFDETGRAVFMNRAAEGLLGLSADEIAAGGTSLAAAEALAPLSAIARGCLRESRFVENNAAHFTRPDGGRLPVSFTCAPIVNGELVTGAVLAFRDTTERVAAEQELEFSAFHDQLTCLPNRRLFLDRLDRALLRSRRSAAEQVVLFADVDRFKLINDNLGHAAGDELLCEIANRLAESCRPGDTVARFGGDEFTLLLEDAGGTAAGEAMAARLQQAMRPPVRLRDGREIVATLSVGIASSAGGQADDLLHNADVAMYQAKTAGIGGVHVYNAAAMQARSARRIDVEADLRRAISAGELEVHYQPLVHIATGQVPSVEALVRWRHPTQGMRMPGEFIPIAEETGLVLELGRQVLAAAATQASSWSLEGLRVGVAVNLSPRQFGDPDLLALIEHALDESKLDPQLLCLEITETLAMRDAEETIRMLRGLKEVGVQLAIDDFGTGYSSLSYLKRFPIDIVKIDRSFVKDIETSEVDQAIVGAVVRLAETMDIATVAEGVENARQLSRLRELGCRLAQGYHLCKPRPAAALHSVLERPGLPRPRQENVTPLYA